MTKPNPSDRHEELLYKELQGLKEQGWSVLALGNKQPDAIVISPDKDKIVAIEVLGKKRRRDMKGTSKGVTWDGGRSILYKRWDYGHYDDIFFILFDRSGSDWTQRVVATEAWPEMMANKWVYRTRLQYGKDPKAPLEESEKEKMNR